MFRSNFMRVLSKRPIQQLRLSFRRSAATSVGNTPVKLTAEEAAIAKRLPDVSPEEIVSTEKTANFWRNVSLYLCIPAILLSVLNARYLYKKHQKHMKHLEESGELEEEPIYAYENIRNTKYPWGNGEKTLFWNDKVNRLKKEE
ncbi:cytochrome c oxidase subunit VIa [Schizosaccharomyces japonicus yFS275]|uniref:Cytochrome c oxidase subunit VIa n=1 Tax=Schizosaccharomyces japonicus (strain yFS275 / FY16936) TaxID=402676 RepID=B6K001_SCHJY|nr:cytochrome c oxidase subunit VIa [Schizosaccharomyces japonicus yFS275]EEB06151.2 cytochrome c oxidase subunit VIa [Schizosaccharomyces japonicus yFS275]